MSTGMGFAGILMNITRYLTLFLFFSAENSTEKDNEIGRFKESLVFFSFSGLICLMCIITTIYLYGNNYFIRKINSANFSKKNDLENLEITSNLIDETHEVKYLLKKLLNLFTKKQQIEIQNEENINSSIEAKENKETEKVFPYIWDLATLIFITYAVSFAVYPGVLISYNFFNLPIGFKINSLIFVHNICDTIGRFIPNYFPGKKSQIVLLVFSRCAFLVTYPLLILIQRNYETVNNIIFFKFLC